MPALVYAVLFAHVRFDCAGSPPPYCRRYLLQRHHQPACSLRVHGRLRVLYRPMTAWGKSHHFSCARRALCSSLLFVDRCCRNRIDRGFAAKLVSFVASASLSAAAANTCSALPSLKRRAGKTDEQIIHQVS